MKYTLTAAVALASLVSAQKGASPPKSKGAGSAKTTSKQFTEGGCKGTIFIFARGSTEPGNVVSTAPMEQSENRKLTSRRAS